MKNTVKIAIGIRLSLTACLLYMAYGETGLYTVIVLSLITIEIEGRNILESLNRAINKELPK